MDRKKAVAAQDAAARRYKKKKGDTQGEQPPEKVQKTVTESEVFTELLAFERHLDNLIYKKNLLLQEYPKLHLKRQNRVIRVSVYNTYQNQGASVVVDHTTQRQASEPSSWTLRIDGQLLDTPDNRVDPRQIPKGKKIPKFTSFFKRINVSFDSEQYPDPSHSVEWSKSRIPSSGTNATLLTLFDGQDSVEIKRTGDRETKATILMDFDFQPPRFKLSNPLSKFLDIHTETSARIIHRFFLVVTANNLQDPTDRQKILFPEEIQQLLGCAPSLLISEIPQFLKQHLYPPDPVKLEYNVRLSGDPASFVTQFNVEIDGDESVDLPPLEFQREINQLDAKIEEKLQRFVQHREARDFMLSFSLEPVEFLNNLITSQARDIKIQHAAAYEEQRSHQYYFQPLMIDAATTFLKKDE